MDVGEPANTPAVWGSPSFKADIGGIGQVAFWVGLSDFPP